MISPPVITASQARRMALAAQLLDRPRPAGPVSARRVRGVLERLNVLQVDSVNILARAHEMPLYSRLGAYPLEVLHRRWQRAPRDWTEYWAHEASLVPAHLRPALIRLQRRQWMTATGMDEERRRLLAEQILETLAHSRPLTARRMEERLGHQERRGGHWGWNWSEVKRVLEDLFVRGAVASAGRTTQFERRYALADQVLAPHALLPDPEELDPRQAALQLVRAAAPALGVMTLASVADYYRIRQDQARTAVEQLSVTGELEPVRLQTDSGLHVPAWRHAEAVLPRQGRARALINPFDPLVFHRQRVEQIFGVRYRIGIYTPQHQRTRGYYSLLFLMGEHLVAQVDLAADRAEGRLQVRGAWPERGARQSGLSAVRQALAAELGELAAWLGLEEVVVDPGAPGEVAEGLEAALRRRAREESGPAPEAAASDVPVD